MATTARAPVELYLHSTCEPDAEYVDGEIQERSKGQYEHAAWQRSIQKWFLLHEDEWNIRVLPELRMQVSPTRYRVSDVVVVDHTRSIEQILTHPPMAVFEILSPEDSITRILVKLRDYQGMDVASIFVVDPKSAQIYQYRQGSLEALPFAMQSIGDSTCSIDWRTVQSYLD